MFLSNDIMHGGILVIPRDVSIELLNFRKSFSTYRPTKIFWSGQYSMLVLLVFDGLLRSDLTLSSATIRVPNSKKTQRWWKNFFQGYYKAQCLIPIFYSFLKYFLRFYDANKFPEYSIFSKSFPYPYLPVFIFPFLNKPICFSNEPFIAPS